MSIGAGREVHDLLSRVLSNVLYDVPNCRLSQCTVGLVAFVTSLFLFSIYSYLPQQLAFTWSRAKYYAVGDVNELH